MNMASMVAPLLLLALTLIIIIFLNFVLINVNCLCANTNVTKILLFHLRIFLRKFFFLNHMLLFQSDCLVFLFVWFLTNLVCEFHCSVEQVGWQMVENHSLHVTILCYCLTPSWLSIFFIISLFFYFISKICSSNGKILK